MSEEKGKNKGEWSEIYVFFRLLADGKVYVADKDMNKVGDDVYLEIISIDREEELGQTYRYCIDGDDVSIKLNGEEVKRIPAREFDLQARRIWRMITGSKGSTTFTDERITEFLDSVFVHKISAPPQSGDKFFGGTKDIVLETRDYRSGVVQTMGFSIKSDIDAAATLFNASGDNTNFEFELTGHVDDDVMNEFNGIFNKRNKADGSVKHEVATKDRMRYLKKRGIDLKFVGPVKDTADMNLIMCGGSEMPVIVGEMLKFFYYDNEGRSTSVEEAVDHLAKIEINPALYIPELMNNSSLEGTLRHIYRYKVENLLYSMFTGLRFANYWEGTSDVSGGYIVVKNEGDIVAFHSCIADAFKDFLVNKLKFEAPSCSRHGYMSVYKKSDGKYYIKLALQFRFKLTN